MVDSLGGKPSNNPRTPQWKAADKKSMRCTHCGHVMNIAAADLETHCPKCNHTEWVLAEPNSGERVQIPAPATKKK